MGLKTTLILWLVGADGILGQFDSSVHRQYVNCFKFQPTDKDFPREIANQTAVQGSVEGCVGACQKEFFMYAGMHDGDKCFCGSTYGRYGPGVCKSRCSQHPADFCGGSNAISVYSTDMTVPGPPSDLELITTDMTSLAIRWMAAKAPDDFVSDYHVYVDMIRSFDHRNQGFSPKHLQLSKTATGTRIVGLRPGALYNVSVAAASEQGTGPVVSDSFWTEIAAPDKPATPELVSHHGHGDGDDDDEEEDDGEIHIRFEPLDHNRGGPITAYRIVVINETEPTPFYEENLYPWEQAQEMGLKYWIAAEIAPDWFDTHKEFVVGDGRFYGSYQNFGPLAAKYDFHVTVGAVSTFKNVTKVTYADVSHDQHSTKNIIVFEFHSHDHDHEDHGHEHGRTHKAPIIIKDQENVLRSNPQGDEESDIDGLTVGLIIGIVVCSFILLAIVLFYVYLRWRVTKHSSGSNGDAQELTAQYPGSQYEAGGDLSYENEAVDLTALDGLRETVWQIPRNFLELTHEVIGRGRFGSVIKGKVTSREGLEAVIVQVVPGKILERSEIRAMIRDIEVVAKFGDHPNILRLIGLCEEQDAIYVVLEEGIMSFKQVLLDSRALVHNPVYVQKNRRISTLDEAAVIGYLLGIAEGMKRLEEEKIIHRKLCARNVMISSQVAKIAGVGIADFARPGQEMDMARWRAQESFKSLSISSKSDVWSFGVLMWEALTLGATPYPEVKTRDLANRIGRGMRLPQPQDVSDDLYQLMLECWQHDLDERPTFTDLVTALAECQPQSADHVSFRVRPGYEYDHFANELELL